MKVIVIKVGSNIITTDQGLNESRIASIAKAVSEASDAGYSVAVVSSGAIAAGKRKLSLMGKAMDVRLKQASAAVGQSSLILTYEKKFSSHGRVVAQVLVTRDAFDDRRRYINVKNTFLTLFSLGVIPVINENDSVSAEEIKFGDNDQLASLVAGMLEAERLFILSDVEGLYSDDPKKNPKATLIEEIDGISDGIQNMAKSSTSSAGTGGMYSKLLAAKRASEYGATVHIINGRKPGAIVSILQGKNIGTVVRPKKKSLSSRKGWIALGVKSKGEIVLDSGAVEALVQKGRSLLPSGIVDVRGDFDIGDAVYCIDSGNARIAKGLTNYSSKEILKIKGRKTPEIEKILGYRYSDEVIHRDNLVKL
jgi:glutamate 5-kinase